MLLQVALCPEHPGALSHCRRPAPRLVAVEGEHARLEFKGGRLYCTALTGDPDQLLSSTRAWLNGAEMRPGEGAERVKGRSTQCKAGSTLASLECKVRAWLGERAQVFTCTTLSASQQLTCSALRPRRGDLYGCARGDARLW